MKKNIGSTLALYPTPAVVVGTFVDGKINWMLVAHIGIMGHNLIMLSMHKTHLTNKGVKELNKVSVNIIDEKMIVKADYVGSVSGDKTDKSVVFEYETGEAGMPVINESPLTMECEVIHNYETDTFDNFICTIRNTYAEESILAENGKIDYNKLKPVLFEMPTYSYLRTGEVIGKCRTLGKEYQQEAE
jgi:flavin reductase (DIM6/NTAB) family NADH-FMN oxidoreductase RutF